MSELVTFAGPRVGDAAFASSFDAALGKQTTTNLYHDLDPVLAQNQPLWDALGFVHAGRTAAGQGGLARCPLPRLARSGPCGNPPHQQRARLLRAALCARPEPAPSPFGCRRRSAAALRRGGILLPCPRPRLVSLSRLRSARDPSAVHRAGLVRCSATEPRLLPAEEARSGLPLNFADHALYLGTYLGPRGGS